MILKRNKEKEFLNRFYESFKSTDESGNKKEAALLYLQKNGLDPESIDDIFKAMDNSLKESNRLLSVEEDLAKQGDSPADVPWLCEAQTEVTMQQHGLILIMLELRNKDIDEH